METQEPPPRIQLHLIHQVFRQRHIPLTEQAPNFNADYQIEQIGSDTLNENLLNMLAKETVAFPNLNPLFQTTFREQSCFSVLQFGIQTQCLDQTILQAIAMADEYLRQNEQTQSKYLSIIMSVCLSLSIKMNEACLLRLNDLVTLFENQYSLEMMQALERHILQLNLFKMPVTSMDFLLYFTTLCKQFPLEQVDKCLPFLHYCAVVALQYRKSSIAIASVCYMTQYLQTTAQLRRENRDQWLLQIISKYKKVHIDEVESLLDLVTLKNSLQEQLWPMPQVIGSSIQNMSIAAQAGGDQMIGDDDEMDEQEDDPSVQSHASKKSLPTTKKAKQNPQNVDKIAKKNFGIRKQIAKR